MWKNLAIAMLLASSLIGCAPPSVMSPTAAPPAATPTAVATAPVAPSATETALPEASSTPAATAAPAAVPAIGLPTAAATAQAVPPGAGRGPGAATSSRPPAAAPAGGGVGSAQARGRGPDCAQTSVGLTPLIDLGTGTYHGYPGGLYPGGSDQPPASYEQVGLAHARAVQPLNATGQPDPSGKVVLLSVGMSNATLEFSEFKREVDASPRKNPRLVIVDGAQPSKNAEVIKNAADSFWSVLGERMATAGVSDQQVQVIWLKEAIGQETEPFPTDAKHLQQDEAQIVQILQQRFPHLQIIYVSSRTYGGYAVTSLNPESFAYDSGFGVKWLVQSAILSGGNGPWLAWGPYLWTDGTRGRSDGLRWTCADVLRDGTHASPQGQRKVAHLLSRFFSTDPTAKTWFLRAS
jgi:hypothetical protein